MTKEKFFTSMGWVGMVTSILMYIFYFPQIENNLAGHKGTFIQPFMAGINCTLWVCYGLFKEKRDLPLARHHLRLCGCFHRIIKKIAVCHLQ